MAFDLIRRVQSLGRPRLLVVGDLILDRYIWGDAERISQEAPVPLLRADHREHRLGGAASVATMLAALGAEVQLVGIPRAIESAACSTIAASITRASSRSMTVRPRSKSAISVAPRIAIPSR
jgi:bifunctional ADP-heptose synthase (sugar kinase/adenylyltransferase)